MFRATDKNESCYAINGAWVSQFITTGKIAISGNIMTLLDKTGQQTNVPKLGLGYLFGGSGLSNTDNDAIISGPFFPSSITDIYNENDWSHSYQEIFASCSSLKSVSFPNIIINDVKTIITNSKMFGFNGNVRNEPIKIECKDGTFYYNYEEN